MSLGYLSYRIRRHCILSIRKLPYINNQMRETLTLILGLMLINGPLKIIIINS